MIIQEIYVFLSWGEIDAVRAKNAVKPERINNGIKTFYLTYLRAFRLWNTKGGIKYFIARNWYTGFTVFDSDHKESWAFLMVIKLSAMKIHLNDI